MNQDEDRSDTVTTDELAEWVREAAQRLTELVSDLDDAQLRPPVLPIVNPLLWEIGHVTWFQEAFVLRGALREPPLVERADALWDSAAIPHDTRWSLHLPSREEMHRYITDVTDRVIDGLWGPWSTRQLRYVTRYTVHHHDMHTEALTYTRQTLAYPPPTLSTIETVDAEQAGPLTGDADIPGGTFLLGADRDTGFVHDNEKWAHPVQVEPFGLARAPVTQAEYAAFVEDGGYRRRELWDVDGWEWRRHAAAEHPVYWQPGRAGWQRRDFDQWVPLEPDRPVSHVCWHEATAYARWAGRRLPTEAEWEAAALAEPDAAGGLKPHKRRFPWGDEPVTTGRANLDWRHMGTADVAAYPEGDSAFGCRQLLGNLWEWTASTFTAYPGFEQDVYRDNSVPSFGSRKVLRGGAWATRARLAHGTIRNYFTPDRRDVLAGFRTAA